MFSQKFSLNMTDVLSSAKTALISTVGYFGLTVVSFASKVISGDYSYVISVVGMFLFVFAFKLLEKYLRNGTEIEKAIIATALDQNIPTTDTNGNNVQQ